MAKTTFGKIVVASTLLAGAAVGAYSYLKNNGMLPSFVPADEDSTSSHVSDVANDIINKDRNYVDLNATDLKADTVKETPESFEAGIQAEKVTEDDNHVIGSTTTEEFFNDEEA